MNRNAEACVRIWFRVLGARLMRDVGMRVHDDDGRGSRDVQRFWVEGPRNNSRCDGMSALREQGLVPTRV